MMRWFWNVNGYLTGEEIPALMERQVTFTASKNHIFSKPVLWNFVNLILLDQRFSNCGTGTPWDTWDTSQGYNKSSFTYT
jgi:hypothetical protein